MSKNVVKFQMGKTQYRRPEYSWTNIQIRLVDIGVAETDSKC